MGLEVRGSSYEIHRMYTILIQLTYIHRTEIH
jgi:hypothetical protein